MLALANTCGRELLLQYKPVITRKHCLCVCSRYGPTREAAKQFIETRGGEFHLQLRRSTQYLVKANKKPGENKLKQARAWDIPILTEQEFNALIEERILQLQGYLDFDLD